MLLTFMGATETVTGSKYLITNDDKKIMVDCGLFQGLKELRMRNWQAPPVNPRDVDAIILTHAHIDHSGYLPRFAKHGFSGPIYATPATHDLCNILLPDSGYLHEEEAARANKYGYSKHHPALPLYTKEDAEAVLEQFSPIPFGKIVQLGSDIHFQFQHAGHILGASFVRIKERDTSIMFSGDMGRFRDPVMHPPATIQAVDYLVLESTYGNRVHSDIDPIEQLGEIINKTINRKGSLVIPSFAVGRAQNLLYYIYKLKTSNVIPNIPVYLDSPMAVSATNLFCKYAKEHNLSKDETNKVCDMVKYVSTVEDSKALDETTHPIIIISASGMATGGRVLHHLKAFATDERNTILLSGFQAAGTRGDRFLKGEKQIKMLGKMVPIKAEVLNLENTSAHADQPEILAWLGKFTKPPRKVFLTHGEKGSSKALKEKIIDEFGWNVVIPKYLQQEIL